MEAITKRVVTAEFRTEAVKLVIEQGHSAAEVARRLSIPYQTLYNWVVLAKKGKLSGVDAKRIIPVSPLEAELSRLKKEVAVLREERDILMALGHPEKATAFFAKVKLPPFHGHLNLTKQGVHHVPETQSQAAVS